MSKTPSAREVMANVWARENGFKITPGESETAAGQEIATGIVLDVDSTEDIKEINNPVDSYIDEMIVDLVAKKHIRITNMRVIRSVFRAVLLRLCDAEPHTFSDIRSTITPTRRDFVKQVITRLQKANLVVEVELNNRLFYRAVFDELAKIRAYIVATSGE